jgi:membrane fusion protein (multidrug efflux system)
MKTIPLVIGAGVATVLVLGALMVWRAAEKVNKVSLATSAKPVTIVQAKGATFRPSRVYVGTLQPWVEARVGPQFLAAYVDTVLVRPGAVVRKNEVLATLDCRNASATNQAVSMQARAIDAKQKAMADEAARLRSMLEGGFVSPNEAEQKTAMSSSQEAELLSQKAKMMNSALEVSDCVLRAPFDGEVATRTEDPGAFVRPGTQIVSVVDRSIIRVVGDAPEIDFGAVAPDTIARVHVLATGKDMRGTIARRAPAADPGTRTIHFEIDIPDPERQLPVGTTAEISIDVGEPSPATELPLYAASIRGEKAIVYVVDGDIAHARTVEVKGEIGGNVFLATDLSPGAHVVTDGRALLEDGDHVAVKEATP